ncbi:MAG: hypothetical protein R6W82_03610 [bacterium]
MESKPESAPRVPDEGTSPPSALHSLEPVIRHLLSSLRGSAAASQALLFMVDPGSEDGVLLLIEESSDDGPARLGETATLPSLTALASDFPEEGPVVVDLPSGYAAVWETLARETPDQVLWVPLTTDGSSQGGIVLSGGSSLALSDASRVEIRKAAEDLSSLLHQVIRLERENVMFSQLINMLRATRNLMRESEAGHLVNMTLSTLSRIVGNNRLALFPTTVLGRYRTFVRHVEKEEAEQLHERMLEHLKPREDDRVHGRQAGLEPAELFHDGEFESFSRVTPWVLRDSGRTFLGMLYLFDNDPAQEDILTHSVIRTIVVELERTLRRYLLEDDAAHAVSELPYRIWSREYWMRRFEEEINLTGRRGTRVACGILEVLDFERLAAELDDLLLRESMLTFLQVVKSSVRETDLITRLDRSHFGVLFLDAPKAKVVPAMERIGSRLQQVVGGAAMAPRISFVAGLSEFPWDGEGVPTILRRAWTASIMARVEGPFTVTLYDHEEAREFLDRNEELGMEMDVHLELLGNLVLPASAGSIPPVSPEER